MARSCRSAQVQRRDADGRDANEHAHAGDEERRGDGGGPGEADRPDVRHPAGRPRATLCSAAAPNGRSSATPSSARRSPPMRDCSSVPGFSRSPRAGSRLAIAAAVQYLVLSRPAGRGVRLDVARGDGEVVYTGTAERPASDRRWRSPSPTSIGRPLRRRRSPACSTRTARGWTSPSSTTSASARGGHSRLARSGALGGLEKLQRAAGRAARWYRPKVMPSSALLIHITGHDRPGVTFGLTSILARHGVRVLDIGQAVIHDALALGMLVELPDELRSSTLFTDLLLEAHTLGVQIRFAASTSDEYGLWVRAQAKRRFIVTVLGPRLEAADIAAVAGILADAGLNIDRIDRLSARVPLELDEQTPPRVCVEFSASAPVGRLADRRRRRADPADRADRARHDRRRLPARVDLPPQSPAGGVRHGLHADPGRSDRRAGAAGRHRRRRCAPSPRPRCAASSTFRSPSAGAWAPQGLAGVSAGARHRGDSRSPRAPSGSSRCCAGSATARRSSPAASRSSAACCRSASASIACTPIRSSFATASSPARSSRRSSTARARRRLLQEIAASEGLSLEQCIAVGDGANDLPMLRLAGLGIAFRAKPVVRSGARQSISSLGLDGILYLIGVRDREAG